jgi:hypothetical protein
LAIQRQYKRDGTAWGTGTIIAHFSIDVPLDLEELHR